jgi:uncharacterized membrane protein YfhO
LWSGACQKNSENSVDRITITSYENEKVEMLVQSSARQLLVFSDTYYPGWTVYVNGLAQEINKVNYIQRGIVVPAGESKVVWIYDPLSYKIGKYISLVSLGVLVFLSAKLLFKRTV